MITRQQADHLEKLMGQIQGMHTELTSLNKKSPHDGVNRFKLGFINAALADCNELLGQTYRPLGDFVTFNVDDLPTNSDVTFILAQYLESLDKMRSDNVVLGKGGGWSYHLSDGEHEMRAAPPARLQKK
jgi:hypothetical protein